MLMLMIVTTNATEATHQVGFGPGEDTPDLIQLFTRPELWATTRTKVNVFQFSPALAGAKHSGPNGLAQLAAAGAFQSLRNGVLTSRWKRPRSRSGVVRHKIPCDRRCDLLTSPGKQEAPLSILRWTNH